MKKTSLAKRNALLSGRTLSGGIFAFIFVFGILFLRLVTPNIFLSIITPVFRVSDTLAGETKIFFAHFSDAAQLANLNEKLTIENATLGNENSALEKKITDLSGLLGVTNVQKEMPGILAGVVVSPPVSPYDTLVLAAGSRIGVTLGMEAFGSGEVPIGFVSSVLNDFSRVTLFSSSGVTVQGWVGSTNVALTLTGVGGGAFRALVSRAANIVVGDSVFVPGPGRKMIGTVVRIDSDPLSPGVTLHIMPAINIFSTAWVILRTTGVMDAIATSTLP